MSGIPKPQFDSCNETSIKVKWPSFDEAAYSEISIQYKLIQEDWETAKQFSISANSLEVDLDSKTGQLPDLEPGTD